MTKKELREKYKLKRQNLSLSQLDDLSISIANQVLKLPIWDLSFFHVFLSITAQKEVNTDFILNILAGKDKNIVVSKSNFETLEMTNFLLTDATRLKINSHNIPEPVDGIEIPNDKIEVVFVPLLAFNAKGHRVGYGKGFYDRFLNNCKKNTIKIGLSFFDHEERFNKNTIHDIPLNYCITPNLIYNFRNYSAI